eukprot:s4628_g10.t1
MVTFMIIFNVLLLNMAFRAVVLSMDTAVSTDFGDLSMSSSSWKKLLACYEAGRVAGTLCGPPCETYSEARFTAPPEPDLRWPRPVRSAERLFGLDGLTMRELKQVSVGSSFFLQCMHVLALHMRYGGVFLAEHPAPPQDVTRPSIWSSEIVQCLLQHPDLELHTIAQYLWGATAVKPTGLLAWQLPCLRRDLFQYADFNTPKPCQAAIGRGEDGAFRTSKHKEYPQRFCEAIAASFLRQLRQFLASSAHRYTVPDPCIDSWVAEADAIGSTIDAARGFLPS